ncbi:MAG TPA: hypothetical protein EYP35_02095 [Desulfobacterales bacterium]|nr:hypothetical protein [Desulfobacterales bacterium]HIP40247.1 hypothetical protein [Desulfocapsa sulfexigens]
MRILISFIFLSAVIAGPAYGDYFQFIDRQHNSFLTYRSVFVNGRNIGYTDGYGRIRIELRNGPHMAILKYQQSQDRVVEVMIDRSNRLKVITVP